MPVDQMSEVLTIVATARAGGSSTILIIGLVIVVVLLLGALSDTTRELAEVATTAIGGIFRNLGTMLVAVVVLVLLVATVANGAPADPGISTVAPGQQADEPAADPGGSPGGVQPPDPRAEGTAVG